MSSCKSSECRWETRKLELQEVTAHLLCSMLMLDKAGVIATGLHTICSRSQEDTVVLQNNSRGMCWQSGPGLKEAYHILCDGPWTWPLRCDERELVSGW